MKIRKIYTRDAVTIEQTASLQNAAHLMRDLFVRDVIVVEQVNGKGEMPVGILTDRDIVVKVIGNDMAVTSLCVKDIMNTDIITIREDAEVDECLEYMRNKAISRMPVVDKQGVIKGVLSVSDILSNIQKVVEDLVEVLKVK